METTYKTAKNPLLGDNLWIVHDVDLAVGGNALSLVNNFLKQYPHDNWSLSIFDLLTNKTAEIACSTSEIPAAVDYLYHLEHATPLAFIGENSLTSSYVVAMNCTRGKINIPGLYEFKNNKLSPKI